MVEVERAVHGIAFLDQLPEAGEARRRQGKVLRIVGDRVELDVMPNVELARVTAGQDR